MGSQGNSDFVCLFEPFLASRGQLQYVAHGHFIYFRAKDD